MAYGQNAPRCDLLTLKEPGFLDPSHSRGGGQIPPPKILESDWRNIKVFGTSG